MGRNDAALVYFFTTFQCSEEIGNKENIKSEMGYGTLCRIKCFL